LLGALAGSGLGCVPPRDPSPTGQSQSPGHLVAPALVDLGTVELAPGPAKVSVSVEGQGSRELALWLPEGGGPHPLAIFLHGAGGGRWLLGSTGIVTCLVMPALEPLHPIIVAPVSASGGQWWTEADIGFVLGLVDAARKSWPVAPEKTFLLGYSNGGIGTWFFARQYPERFSAAIPMAANDTIVGATPLPVFAISGDKDELFPIADVRRAIAAAKARGQNVTLHEKYRGTHMKACSYVRELEAARDWLTARIWKRPSLAR
jgi:predicted esterase